MKIKIAQLNFLTTLIFCLGCTVEKNNVKAKPMDPSPSIPSSSDSPTNSLNKDPIGPESNNPQLNTETEEYPLSETSSPEFNTSTSYEIEDIRELCNKTPTASFDEALGECRCKDTYTKRGSTKYKPVAFGIETSRFNPKAKGVCVDFERIIDTYSKEENPGTFLFRNKFALYTIDTPSRDSKLQLEIETIRPHLILNPNPSSHDLTPSMVLRLNNKSRYPEGKNWDFSRMTAKEIDKLAFYLPPTNPFGNEEMGHFPFVNEGLDLMRDGFELDFYEPHTPFVKFALGDPDFSAPKEFFDIAPGTSPYQKLIETVYQNFLNQNIRTTWRNKNYSIESRMNKKCFEKCLIKVELSEQPSSDYPDFYSTYYKTYVRGQRALESIRIIRKSTGIVEASVVLNYGGGISHILVTENLFIDEKLNLIKDANKVGFKYEAYDRNWIPLLKGTPEEKQESLDFKMSNLLAETEFKQPVEPRALLCDSGALPMSLRTGAALFGPHRKTESTGTGSYWGWFKNENGNDWRTFFDGILETPDHEDFVLRGDLRMAKEGHGHGVDVAQAFLEGSKYARVSFMNPDRCFSRIEDWGESVKNSGIKVISVSTHSIYDHEQCEQFAKTLNSPLAKEFVWVIASGNAGATAPNRTNCPLNLKSLPNLILVSATTTDNPKELAKYSNYGTDFSHLAANGDLLSSNKKSVLQKGTSFATPRVSFLAAEIALKFPKLSPSEIKWAVLLGTETNFYEPLQLRTGGILSRDPSHKIAKFLEADNSLRPDQKNELRIHSSDKIPKDIAEKLLEEIYGFDFEVEEKLSLLKRGNLLR